ncbi:hypothetical protein BSKO_12506 [Bryopsis sp. KO-2023]|nr:hypothetical protein BSKO_12506 [Bryopsis sp. KO-2023]
MKGFRDGFEGNMHDANGGNRLDVQRGCWKPFSGEKEDPLASYYKRLTSPDLDTVERAANRWRRWEMTVMFSGKCIVKAGEIFNAAWEPIASIMKKRGGEKKPDKKDDDADGGKPKPTRSISHAQPLLECHYSINGAFLDEPLIAGVDRIRDIPCIGVQGRLDFVRLSSPQHYRTSSFFCWITTAWLPRLSSG